MTLEHAQLKQMAERSADLTSDARELAERDRDYYDGFQWTAEETAILRKRKQPVITINRIKRKIDAMVGIEQRGRVDPRAYPRNPSDEDAAELATKALVYVEEAERVDVKRSSAFENLLVEGFGGVEVVVEQSPRGEMDVKINRLRWEEIFFDPHSREKDFSDAAYVGVMKWMTLDSAVEYAMQFSDQEPEELRAMLDVSGGVSEVGDTYDDRPQRETGRMAWVDKRFKRVRVAQMYYRNGGDWFLAIYTGRGVIYNEPSPYYDVFGRSCCPIVLMSAYVDRENRRYGLVRDMISPQDEINKRRSKLLNLLNHRQTIGIKGVIDAAKVKRELSQPDGHIELDPQAFEDGVKPFDIIPTTDMTAGQFSLLVEAKQEIDNLGPNASLLGQLEGQQSGRAIMAQQQAGLAELAPIYDSLRDWTERVYRAMWDRIKQFWTEPRWLRITEDERAPQFIGLNQQAIGPMGEPVVVNNVAEIDVDIIIDQSPDYATLRHEQFQRLTEMAQAGIPIPPQVLIEASDLRDKRKLLEAMQPDPQQAAMQAEMAARGAAAEIGAKEARAMRDTAAAQKDMAALPKAQAEGVAAQIEAAAKGAMARQVGL